MLFQSAPIPEYRKLQFYQCGPCTVDYNIVTQLDHATAETKFILEYLNLTGDFLCTVTDLNRVRKMQCSYLKTVPIGSFGSEITHFGERYTHQDSSESISGQIPSRRSPSDPWESLPKDVIEGVYRHYWLDFILYGFEIPHQLINTR